MSHLPLHHLHAHPRNSNVMPEPMLKKLVANIERTGQYPPIVVRPLPEEDNAYQILDGHHRVEALKRLDHKTADCVVWEVDDNEALSFVATLNRLRGEDDPRKRGALVNALSQRVAWQTLVERLPEDQPKLRKLLELHRQPPTIQPPTPVGDLPVAVHFFLLPAQRDSLEARLSEFDGPREQALMRLVNA